jgi:acetylornithine/N-succinyldiaminopimelate aminotransferase
MAMRMVLSSIQGAIFHLTFRFLQLIPLPGSSSCGRFGGNGRRFRFWGCLMSHVMNTYARLPVAFSHGQGSRITDTEGKEYLDALSGIAVSTLGHAHPKLVAAIAAQAGRLLHTSNLYAIREQEQLVRQAVRTFRHAGSFLLQFRLRGQRGGDQAGAFLRAQKGHRSPTIIVMEKAFHGRTMATLSATGNRKAQAGFEPLVSWLCPRALRRSRRDQGGCRAQQEHRCRHAGNHSGRGRHPPGFDRIPERACASCATSKGWLLICDEVQCGMARTGKWFGYQHAGIQPDIATLAKGLGSGVPIGACMTSGKAAGLFGPGNHGSTFGGNPLACTAALTTIETIEQDGLMANAEKRRCADSQVDGEALAGAQGRGRNSRPWPDDRHRAGSSVRRTGGQGAGCRAADQRDGRQGDSPFAAADLQRK